MKGEQVVQLLEALWLNFLSEVGSQFLRAGLVGLGKRVIENCSWSWSIQLRLKTEVLLSL